MIMKANDHIGGKLKQDREEKNESALTDPEDASIFNGTAGIPSGI